MLNDKVRVSLIAIVLTCGMPATVTSANAADSSFSDQSQPIISQATTSQSADVEAGLSMLASIPDEVLLQGDAATQQWLQANPPGAGASIVSPKDQASTTADFWGCSGSIALMLAGVALPAAKILKIKKLMNELGGVSEAVKLMWGASFSYEKMQVAGGALASLGAELLGIAGVQEKCFN